jgi:hypothetical protein
VQSDRTAAGAVTAHARAALRGDGLLLVASPAPAVVREARLSCRASPESAGDAVSCANASRPQTSGDDRRQKDVSFLNQ